MNQDYEKRGQPAVIGHDPKEAEMILTDQERELVLATAKYDKIKRIQWLNGTAWGEASVNDNIELTYDESEKALRQANSNKHTRIYFEKVRSERRELQRLEQEALLAKWNYGHFFRYMKDEHWKRTGQQLVFNQTTEDLIKTACFRLSNDRRYETEMGFSFSRGLIIKGSVGLGKSYIFDLIKDNPVCPIQIITMNEVTREVIEKGDFTGTKFGSYSIVYFDDVGTEYFGDNAIKRYGTEINWFKNFIENVYAKDKTAFRRVIFSTNDSFDQLEAKYGFRVRDRLAECFDVLTVSGESFRRKH